VADPHGGGVMTWAHLVWYVDRAAGFTALVLLTASILLGLTLSLKVASPRWPRFLTNDVHEHITLMALVFIAIHGFAILIDPFMHFGWGDVLVPFGSAYHPAAMALGIVAGYLALAIWLSSRVRKRIGFRMWRRLHYATFAVYAFAGAHTLLIGNDRSTSWGRAVVMASVALVVAMTAVRVATSGSQRPAEVAGRP
jgi:predicted ferric reductase